MVTEEDVMPLTEILKRAFDDDTMRHIGENGGPRGYDTGEYIKKWYLNKSCKAYKVLKDRNLIGGVSVIINDSGENYLSSLFIAPAYQGKGLGKLIWTVTEEMYPNTRKWSGETPGYSKRNHHFYVNKCGFKIVQIKNSGDI